VAVEHGHARAGRVHEDGLVAQDLARPPHHLHLFLGVAVVQETFDVRQHVEGNLLRIQLALDFLEAEQLAGLLRQLLDRLLPVPDTDDTSPT